MDLPLTYFKYQAFFKPIPTISFLQWLSSYYHNLGDREQVFKEVRMDQSIPLGY